MVNEVQLIYTGCGVLIRLQWKTGRSEMCELSKKSPSLEFPIEGDVRGDARSVNCGRPQPLFIYKA